MLAALLVANASAQASANIDCSIDDKAVHFELEAIASRNGPIVQVGVGELSIKPGAGFALATPQLTFGRPQIIQQWIAGDEIRLHIEIEDSAQIVELVILARLNEAKEKYFGSYVLKLGHGGKNKTLTGRIKECQAG